MIEIRNPKARLIIFIALAVLSPLIQAAPVVIYDAGGEPLAPYIQRLFEETPDAGIEPTPPAGPRQTGPFALPITTPEMTPGRVTPRPINQPYLSRPLFLIGSDRLSLQWLVQNRKRLGELQAAGIIVQAETLEDLRAVARLLAGFNIQIMPAPASDIARSLGIEHYPVLIGKHGIEQ